MMSFRTRIRPLGIALAAAALLFPAAAVAIDADIALTGPWGVVGWLAGDAAGSSGAARSAAYREGQQALDAENWKKAADVFRRVAAEKGGEADAALYWLAYAQSKDGKEAEALTALRELRSSYPQSSWLDDGAALEVEMRGPQSVSVGSAAESEELKLYALNALMQAESSRAVPVLQKFLQGNASPRLKKQALFVLGQNGSPEARALLAAVALGRSTPGMQREAIEMLGVAGGKESIATLTQIYRESPSAEVREAVLHAYLVADAEGEVLAIAQGDKDPEIRRKAIHQLGAMDAGASLRQLYSREGSVEVRRAILEAMGVAGDVDALAQAARGESDAGLRRAAIHGLGITDSAESSHALKQLYAAYTDGGTRRAVIEALFIQDNAKALIELFRAEKDAAMRREIVQKLSLMDSPEATELLMKMLDQ